MLWTIAAFEARQRLRLPSTKVYFLLNFVSGLLFLMASGGAFKGVNVGIAAGGRTLVNSPFALHTFITLTSYFSLQITAAFMGQAIVQDFESRAAPLFFTMPVTRREYLAGRFLGALAALVVVFSSIGLGCFVGTLLPGVQPSLLGPNRLMAYVWPYVVGVLPNVLFTGAIFFSLAALTRKIRSVQAAGVVLLVGYLIAASLMAKIENHAISALVDPLGLNATYFAVEHWPIAEQNTRLVPFTGLVLQNRLLWLGIGAAMLALAYARFRFDPSADAGAGRRAPSSEPRAKEAPLPLPSAWSAGPAPAAMTPMRYVRLLLPLTWLTFKETVKHLNFLIIILAGLLTMILGAQSMGAMFGTATHPVTYAVLEITAGTFSLFLTAIIISFSGELVFREREARLSQITDALPIPTSLPFASKLLALFMVQALLMVVVMATGIGIQLAHGYTHFELGQYATELFGVRLVRLCLVSVLALTVQTLVNNKYAGHTVMVVYYVAVAFLPRFGFESHLYQYATVPRYVYSDMNGYGHFAQAILWFSLYWTAAAVILGVVTSLAWIRGEDHGIRARLRIAKERLQRPVLAVIAVAALAFAGLGRYIHHNISELGRYRTQTQAETLGVETERLYAARAAEPSPRIEGVSITCEVFPAERRFEAKGTYRLKNRTDASITRVLVHVPADAAVKRLSLGKVEKAARPDATHGYWDFDLDTPLAPGAETTLDFSLGYHARGFANEERERSRLAENGTFIDSSFFPRLGYMRAEEISDDDMRKKHGLPPRPRMADLDDPAGRQHNYVSADADFIDFDATVITSADQMGVAPGTLDRTWEEGGRRGFHYRSPGKILGFWAILSARWAKHVDRWNGVAIEIDHHPTHGYNVARMAEAVKASLAYFTAQFGPYQHDMVRILEFPRYQAFAQSFPNTIPFSERVGFIAKVDPAKEDDIDYPYYVTAHEVAHQWWAHQVIGADVQGATLLSETLAQYSALMVMKERYGAGKMRRFLRYELDRYLIGRGTEKKKELPLARVENQTYIHYQKGSLAMYALQDRIGEAAVNRALAGLVRTWGFHGPPYPRSTDLVAALREVTPPEQRSLVEDLFETITLYDNRAISASCTTHEEGGKRITLRVSAKKLRADELGAEHEVPLDELVDVGALDEHGEPIALEKRRITTGEQEIELHAPRCPQKAGIDPLNVLVDRVSDDNVVRVEKR
ncbi:membrane protein, putative [Minicystis rosea]|nr:membrane protein, putative [Minicystis rosea]